MKKIGKRMMAAMLTFVLFFAMVPETVCVKNVRPFAKQILSDYEKSSQYQKHPRIMITKQIVDDQLKPIASNVNDPRNALYNKIMTRAEKLCVWIVDQNSQDQLPKYSYKYESRMPVNGNPENPSGGNTSDDFKYKIMVLGLAYQMTDVAAQKKRYAEQKERLQNAIVRLCFQVANESYAKKSVFKEVKHNLQKSKLGTGNMKGVEYVHNHNSFVNSGVIMAALALIDEYPANARQNDGELYYVNVDWLNAGEMRKTIYATVMKGDKKVSNTCRYSIESYVVSMRTDGSTKLDKLLDAMMRYGDSAAAYAKQN